MRRMLSGVVALAAAALIVAAGPAAGEEGGRLQVTAKLVKIPGKFPPDDLYDYAYVMQYQVLDGALKGKRLLVAHYKPRRARSKIKDKMKKHVGGSVKRFKEGAVHRLSLDPRLKKIWKGAVVDDFFATDRKSVRYWCLRADRVK